MVDLAQTIEEWKDIQSVKVDDQVCDTKKDKHKKRQKDKKTNRKIDKKTKRQVMLIKARIRFRK